MRTKSLRWLLASLALCSFQSGALAADFDFYGLLRGVNPERYGCCLIRTDVASDTWEYIEGTSFGNCYKWSQAVGNPYQYHQDRKFEFFKDQKCVVQEKYKNATPSQYTYIHEGNS